jgi:hypothetical protein
MALSCAVLFATIFGIIQLSLALFSYSVISEASREAARYALVRGSECVNFSDCGATYNQIQSHVRSLGYPGLNNSNVSVNTNWYTVTVTDGTTPTSVVFCGNAPTTAGVQCNLPGNVVQVQVVYNYPLSIPFWRSTQVKMQSQSSMVISQ